MEIKASDLAEVAIMFFLENKGTTVVDCLVGIGFASSKSDARRAIEQGSIKVGNQKINSIKARVLAFIDCVLTVDIDSDGKFNIITGRPIPTHTASCHNIYFKI